MRDARQSRYERPWGWIFHSSGPLALRPEIIEAAALGLLKVTSEPNVQTSGERPSTSCALATNLSLSAAYPAGNVLLDARRAVDPAKTIKPSSVS